MRQRIRVVVRFRPLISSEDPNSPWPLEINPADNSIHDVRKKEAITNFDRVLGADTSQHQVFENTSQELIGTLIDGYNAALLAYGQSGGGKTYSMVGGDQHRMVGGLRGVIPRTAEQLFQRLGEQKSAGESFVVECSAFEIQGQDGKIHDLMSVDPETGLPRGLHGREDRHIEELRWARCEAAEQMIEVLAEASARRMVAPSRQNPLSSRSHMVVTIRLTSTHKSPHKGECNSQMCRSLHLVDLQGSERMVDPDDPYHQHTAGINSALLELGKVMRNLAGDKRAPDTAMFRGSTLTWVLREALGGSSGARICVLLTCSPHEQQYYASTNTLAFGVACTRVRRSAVQSAKVKSVEQLQALVESLRRELQDKDELLRRMECRGPAGAQGTSGGAAGAEPQLRAALEAAKRDCEVQRRLVCELQREGEQRLRNVVELHRELEKAAAHHVALEDKLEAMHKELRQAAEQHVAIEQELHEARSKQAVAEQRSTEAEQQVKDVQMELERMRVAEQETQSASDAIKHQMNLQASNLSQLERQAAQAAACSAPPAEIQKIEKQLSVQLANTQEAVARAEAETRSVQQAAREREEEADAISEMVRRQWMDRIEQVEQTTWQRAVEHERSQQQGPQLWSEVERLARLLEHSEAKAQALQTQLDKATQELAQLQGTDEHYLKNGAAEPRRQNSSNLLSMERHSIESAQSIGSWYSAGSVGTRSSFDSRSLSHSLEDAWEDSEPSWNKRVEMFDQGGLGRSSRVSPSSSPRLRPHSSSPAVQEHFMFEEGGHCGT